MGIELQPTSLEIYGTKYQLKDKEGNLVDQNLDDTYTRVARALADIETEHQDFWFKKFLWALKNGATPAGRIMSNVGAGKYKPATSTINCTVSDTIEDSMDSILTKLREAGITLKAGCGIGYEWSSLRPRGSHVTGAGATTSGPLSFMDIYDKMCFTISSAGGRRGAQMGTFDIQHPDILDFIKAKREDGRLRQFNLSLLITEQFMYAVINDLDFPLVFPYSSKDYEEGVSEVYWREWPSANPTHNIIDDISGKTACKVYKTIKAKELWDAIMEATYDFAEPGFILIDKVNDMNNNWFCEEIRATNPCGEQPLPPYGACLLGSINLALFVINPFTDTARFDWDKYRKVISVFTRMLDNVVELNNLPLSQQREEIEFKRRHGMGYLGLGSALAMMCVAYGSRESIAFTEEVTKVLTIEGYETGIQLAMEKGPAPIMDEEFNLPNTTMALGRHLWAQSKFMQKVWKERPDLEELAHIHGCRFTHHSSIAPTGTIALSVNNNASNGIEPSFAHQYSRNVIISGKKTKKKSNVYSYELLMFRELVNPDAGAYNDILPNYFVDSSSITPIEHVNVQAAAQKWIDSSISKTINVPTDYPFDKFKDIYMYAYEKGLKGCTTFRYNPEAFQGVLVTEENLKNTFYEFTDQEGNVFKCSGEEEIFFDGEMHTAANLYDALKENYYGKF